MNKILDLNLINETLEFLRENREDSEVWSTEIKMIDQCSKAPEDVKVYLMPLVQVKINELMEMFKHLEWLAYLTGEKTNNHFIINDMIIPKQVISTGSVNDVEYSVKADDKIVGVIHSHHTMGAFFSGIDVHGVNTNYDLSVVVAHNGMVGQVRWSTPCGSLMYVPASIVKDAGIVWDRREFMEVVDSNIKKRSELMTINSSIKYIPVDSNDDYPIPKELCGVNNEGFQTWGETNGEDKEDELSFEEEIALLEAKGQLTITKLD